MSAEALSRALTHFARDERIDATHRAVLVRDGAGWHPAGTLVVPEGIELVPLPPASPDLPPVERLRPLVDEAVANWTFPDLTPLEDRLVARCPVPRADRRRVQGHTRFPWWPRDRRPRQGRRYAH